MISEEWKEFSIITSAVYKSNCNGEDVVNILVDNFEFSGGKAILCSTSSDDSEAIMLLYTFRQTTHLSVYQLRNQHFSQAQTYVFHQGERTRGEKKDLCSM